MTPRLIGDILGQPESLRRVLEWHTGPGARALHEAVRVIQTSRVVVLTGMGASLFAAAPLQYALAEAGIRAFLVEAAELLHFQRPLCANAAVILVSRSGETVEVLKLLPELRTLGACTIGVTSCAGSTLSRDASVTLETHHLPDEMVAVQSYTGTLLTLALVGSAATAGRTELAQADWIECVSAAARHYVDASEQWGDFLEGSGPIHLLGRGPAWGSALEGALLLNETAKQPACAFPAGSFRHGPVETVDASFRAVVFASGARTRELDLGLAADLVRFGAQVRVVAPAGPRIPSSLETWETPALPAEVSGIADIIPLQCAAVRLAQRNGLEVGKFRYAPQVTADEMHFPESLPRE